MVSLNLPGYDCYPEGYGGPLPATAPPPKQTERTASGADPATQDPAACSCGAAGAVAITLTDAHGRKGSLRACHGHLAGGISLGPALLDDLARLPDDGSVLHWTIT